MHTLVIECNRIFLQDCFTAFEAIHSEVYFIIKTTQHYEQNYNETWTLLK